MYLPRIYCVARMYLPRSKHFPALSHEVFVLIASNVQVQRPAARIPRHAHAVRVLDSNTPTVIISGNYLLADVYLWTSEPPEGLTRP